MASLSVSVLAPNGRRQTVKCTGNTTIMQIIEEVCRKQGFKPEEYDIKHHNKVLDTTISFRFSGLPNNAQLELTTATKVRTDSEVTMAVNLENGERKMGTFQPDDTLSTVLSKLCPQDVKYDQNPVVIYMRNEIFGDKLAETTLKSLGIRGGRAMIRLVHKSPTELRTQANVSAPIAAKPVEEKPYHRVLKKQPEDTQIAEKTESPVPVQKKAETDLVKLAREKRKAEEAQRSPPTKPKIQSKKEGTQSMEVEPIAKTVQKDEVEREDNFVFLGERNAMLFSLESSKTIPEDLPDEFFELTIDDARRILQDIRRNRGEMENGVLKTAAMRNLEESKKQLRQLHKYKKSVIRVQFSDSSILQGTFTPTETVEDVCNFVREYLAEKSCTFYLYTTPPKNILPVQETLLEVGCVPGALLHLGTDAENPVNLRNDLKDKFTTNSLASLAASKTRKEHTRVVADEENVQETEETMEVASDPSVPGPSSRPTSYERKEAKSTEKVPKWFKTGK